MLTQGGQFWSLKGATGPRPAGLVSNTGECSRKEGKLGRRATPGLVSPGAAWRHSHSGARGSGSALSGVAVRSHGQMVSAPVSLPGAPNGGHMTSSAGAPSRAHQKVPRQPRIHKWPVSSSQPKVRPSEQGLLRLARLMRRASHRVAFMR